MPSLHDDEVPDAKWEQISDHVKVIVAVFFAWVLVPTLKAEVEDGAVIDGIPLAVSETKDKVSTVLGPICERLHGFSEVSSAQLLQVVFAEQPAEPAVPP